MQIKHRRNPGCIAPVLFHSTWPGNLYQNGTVRGWLSGPEWERVGVRQDLGALPSHSLQRLHCEVWKYCGVLSSVLNPCVLRMLDSSLTMSLSCLPAQGKRAAKSQVTWKTRETRNSEAAYSSTKFFKILYCELLCEKFSHTSSYKWMMTILTHRE